MTEAAAELPAIDVSADCETLDRDGIVGLRGAFPRDWVERMREDMMTAFWEAIQRPGGAVSRGPRRWYVEIHPQAFGGFADLCAHPWVTAMCGAVLGPDYRIVEIGFDTPFEGAMKQPWHRDFPSPPGDLARPPHHFARLQSQRRRRDGGHGSVRDRAGYAMGRRARMEA